MASLDLNFTGVERPSYTPVPEGEYVVVMSGCELKPTKANDGMLANMTLEILEPADYAGRKLFASQLVAGEKANPGYTKVWLESFIGQPLESDFTLDTDELVGLTAACFVGTKPDYKDSSKTVNEVKYWILPFEVEG